MAAPARVVLRQHGNDTEIVAELDRRHAEALALEVTSLAKRYGLMVRLERVTNDSG
jgi:hypothetical protein